MMPGEAANGGRPAQLPETMQAAAIDRAGGPEVVILHTLPVPKPDPDEVLIAVHTAGVGIWDTGVRRHPESIEHSRFPLVLGTDGAGIVAAVGSNVRGLKVGDAAYAYSWDNPKGGFYAEFVAVPADRVGHVPTGLGLKEAGAIATTGLTAIQGIDDGEDGLAFAQRLGTDAVVDGRGGDIVAAARNFAPGGVDAVLAFAGGEALERCIDALGRGGRVAFPTGIHPTSWARLCCGSAEAVACGSH